MTMTHEQKQEIFLKVWNGMKAQGFRISQGKWTCETDGPMYRSPNGCKCNIGHLIPDDKYDPLFEGLSVEWPEAHSDPDREDLQAKLNGIIGFDSESQEDYDFFAEIQSIHDGAASDFDIEVGLRAMASENNFQLPNGENPSPF